LRPIGIEVQKNQVWPSSYQGETGY
jgi:hypothetical protein